MAASSPRPALPLLRLDHLWALLALSTIALFISLTPTQPHDFWWHLKAGELIGSTGLPRSNLFAWGLPADHPYIYQSWLGEWLFYGLYRAGGFPLVVFARNLMGTLAFGLVAAETQARSGSWRLGAAAAFGAAAMTINNLTTRTQNWSLLPLMLTLFVLGRFSEGRLRARWLVALPLVMIFWVNAHGAFVMGLLLVGAFVAGETLRRLLRQPRALGWPQLRQLYSAALATGLATLANPLGAGVFGYVGSLLSDSSSQQLVSEWQTPTPRTLAGALFYIGVLGLIAAFAFARRRPSITDVVLVCGLAWQAFIGGRYVVWFGMAAMPIAAQSLAAPRALFGAAGAAPRPLSGRERGGGALANSLAAVLLLGMVLLVQPWIKPLLPWPTGYTALFADLPGAPQLFSVNTPVAAVAHLRAAPCAGPIFNEMGYGSYMAWALYPQAQAFIDPRVELFPDELWRTYIALSRGTDLAAGLDRLGVACVLLDRSIQPQLAAAIATLPGWQRSFADAQSEVWRRAP